MARPSVPTELSALKPIVEAMIFASEEPLGPRTLLRLLFEEEKKGTEGALNNDASLFDPPAEEEGNEEGGEAGEQVEEPVNEVAKPERSPAIGQKELRTIIDELNESYDEAGRSFRIIEIAGGFQFATTREYGEFVGLLSRDRMRRKLSPAALETLAIVAYRQPVTKPEVEAIRGVNCDQVLLSLLERNLIAISGRADTVGKPLLYSTTDEFLRAFGLNSLIDLPKLRELEELMEEDAHSPTKPEIIPEAITDELLELTPHDESAEGEETSEGNLSDGGEALEKTGEESLVAGEESVTEADNEGEASLESIEDEESADEVEDERETQVEADPIESEESATEDEAYVDVESIEEEAENENVEEIIESVEIDDESDESGMEMVENVLEEDGVEEDEGEQFDQNDVIADDAGDSMIEEDEGEHLPVEEHHGGHEG